MASKWRQIWHLAVRSVSIPSTSRAACVLLHSILESGLVSVNEVADDITNIVTAADISGPAILSDASLVFMLHLLHLRNSMLPSTSQKTSGHVVRWVFSKWNPGEDIFLIPCASNPAGANFAKRTPHSHPCILST